MASDFEVTNEIRFAVVMYGGVSLAIYMNGIAQELLHLVRSTARKGWEGADACEFRFEKKDLKGTEEVYRELAKQLTAQGDRNSVRFIVDILSGTSAGGINGIFLSKALANGQSMDKLEDLWVSEGDIGNLLNDAGSTKGVNLPKPSHQKSLLNSDRMYVELLKAFTGMDFPYGIPGSARDSAQPPATAAPAELVEELDLYVTTTDIRGRVIPLRISDRLVYERNYKWAFHFKYNRSGATAGATGNLDGHRDTFQLKNNPFLAFAARSTSSFPVAFEPMCFNKVEELTPSYSGYPYKTDIDPWIDYFADAHRKELSTLKSRSFGDGGYLDNKPFGYVIDTLCKRSSDIPSQRFLLYIDPAPEHPELQPQNDDVAPNAIQNSLAALVTLPTYQPIREDLLRVNDRNRTIRKVTELIDGVSRQLVARSGLDASRANLAGKKRALLQSQSHISLTEVLKDRGAAYMSYALLRVYDATDKLANVVGKALKYEQDSSYFYAVRCLVRAWREMFYERDEATLEKKLPIPAGVTGNPEGRTLTRFLKDFDLAFETRCMKFVTSQINSLYLLNDRAIQQLKAMGITPPGNIAISLSKAQTKDETAWITSFREALKKLKKPFEDRFRQLRSTSHFLHSSKELQDNLAQMSESLLDRVLGVAKPIDTQRGPFAPHLEQNDNDEYNENARRLLTSDPNAAHTVSQLNKIAGIIRGAVSRAIGPGDLFHMLPALAGPGAEAAHAAILCLYGQFSEYDAAVFPVLYGTDVGELDRVEIVRISPEDAFAIVDELGEQVHKLKGIWLGHFGAFLDARWRRSDILWGRLDAAERLIRSLLPGNADDLVRKAHNSILEDWVKKCGVDVAQQLAAAAFAGLGMKEVTGGDGEGKKPKS
jgi:patatin-related protein